MIQPAVPRPPRRWAPDIHEEYISRFRAPAPEPGEYSGSYFLPSHSSVDRIDEDTETEAQMPSGREDELEDHDEDQVEQRKAHHRPKAGVYHAAYIRATLMICSSFTITQQTSTPGAALSHMRKAEHRPAKERKYSGRTCPTTNSTLS